MKVPPLVLWDTNGHTPTFVKTMKTHNSETQATTTPAKALQFLKDGNERFVQNLRAHRNLLKRRGCVVILCTSKIR